MKKENTLVLVHFIVYCFHNRKSKFAALHSDINSLKSGLRHLTGQPYCKKSRSAKIINLIIRNYFIDQYILNSIALKYVLLNDLIYL